MGRHQEDRRRCLVEWMRWKKVVPYGKSREAVWVSREQQTYDDVDDSDREIEANEISGKLWPVCALFSFSGVHLPFKWDTAVFQCLEHPGVGMSSFAYRLVLKDKYMQRKHIGWALRCFLANWLVNHHAAKYAHSFQFCFRVFVFAWIIVCDCLFYSLCICMCIVTRTSHAFLSVRTAMRSTSVSTDRCKVDPRFL